MRKDRGLAGGGEGERVGEGGGEGGVGEGERVGERVGEREGTLYQQDSIDQRFKTSLCRFLPTKSRLTKHHSAYRALKHHSVGFFQQDSIDQRFKTSLCRFLPTRFNRSAF